VDRGGESRRGFSLSNILTRGVILVAAMVPVKAVLAEWPQTVGDATPQP